MQTCTTELTVSTDISALIARRDAIAKELDSAREAFARAERLYQDGPIGFDPDAYRGDIRREFATLGCSVLDRHRFEFDATLQGFDALAWDHLMKNSGLLGLMSGKAKREWERQIYENKTPPFTAENIQATFENLHGRRAEMFEQGVVDAFKACSWDHKTNSPVKFGKKIIFMGRGSVDYDHLSSIDDLRRVFHIGDGKPEPDSRNGASDAIYCKRLRHFEDEHLAVEAFKNGNLHCKFKRPDLVEKLNRILANRYPGALPAPK